MNGYPDGTFGVGRVTQGEFVAVLCRMFGWDAASRARPRFPTAPPLTGPTPMWRPPWPTHGVMDAGGAFPSGGLYQPEEMAVMLVRALGYGTLVQSLSGLELPLTTSRTTGGTSPSPMTSA